jgi:hypothetical protein
LIKRVGWRAVDIGEESLQLRSRRSDIASLSSIRDWESCIVERGENVTQPRAADDFAVIRSRIEELRRERARPRAADDFAAIHARVEELRRERRERAQMRTTYASAP